MLPKPYRFISAAIAGVLLTLGGFAAFRHLSKSLRNQSNSGRTISSGQPAPQSTIPVIDTNNWKTYSNQKYDYSLKYPPDWDYKMVQKYSSNKEDVACFGQIEKEYWYEGSQEDCAIIISVYPQNAGATPIGELIRQWKVSYPSIRIDYLDVSGFPAVRATVPFDTTYIKYRGRQYVVSSLGDDRMPGWEGVSDVISGMLSTFKFNR